MTRPAAIHAHLRASERLLKEAHDLIVGYRFAATRPTPAESDALLAEIDKHLERGRRL